MRPTSRLIVQLIVVSGLFLAVPSILLAITQPENLLQFVEEAYGTWTVFSILAVLFILVSEE